jgi:murein hydrolase activator
LQSVKSKEATLVKQLERSNAEKKSLSKAIEVAINKEIKSKSKKGVYEVTPEMKKLAYNFISNKGKLPWPVNKGVVTGRFGEHSHPFLSNVKVENNGIDISTPKSSDVKVVFKGEVTAVLNVSGSGKSVIVSHGSYRTIYSNLLFVSVTKGDVLITNQTLGSVLTNPTDGKTVSHFEIWHIGENGVQKENPELWLLKR